MPSVSGQVVLVTGATSGIGKSVSELLASLGAKVVLSGRRKEQGELVSRCPNDCSDRPLLGRSRDCEERGRRYLH
jgi:NADP-dependent 3-hydroxy acid dehydrogenase YdfG